MFGINLTVELGRPEPWKGRPPLARSLPTRREEERDRLDFRDNAEAFGLKETVRVKGVDMEDAAEAFGLRDTVWKTEVSRALARPWPTIVVRDRLVADEGVDAVASSLVRG